ncbi:MAG: competence/damage-inducible protein A, partial [Blastocatellia bacterium]|nr:competence/damage-inducible protein A [Blastocatellia bacterium]
MNASTAAILVIGDEILSGKTEDQNARLLIGELRELGVALKTIRIIPDEIEEVAGTVRELSERFDHVFTSGGVGPTHDDITMEGVAAAFGRPVVEHPELRRGIEQFVGSRLSPAHLKMAQVPEGARLLVGGHVAFPTILVENVYILPGIPEIFQDKVVALRDRLRTRPWHLRQVLVRENETRIAEFLNATLAAFPELLL